MKILRFAAVDPQYPHAFGQLRIVGGAQACVAERAQILARKERKAANVADRADPCAVIVGRADGLGGILDHLQSVPARDRHQRIHIGRLAVQMHGHQRLDPAAGGTVDQSVALRHAVITDEGLHRGRRHIEGLGVDIAENRPRPGARDRSRGCKEGKGRGDDLIARADVQGHQREQQSIGAGRYADAGRRPAVARDLLLESVHVRAQNKMLAGAHLVDGGHDFGPNLGKLSLKIE